VKYGKWIIVAYDLPNEPSKARVRAWRTLKKIGAVYPPVSLCLLPYDSKIKKELLKLRASLKFEGQMVLLDATPFGQDDQKQIEYLFREDRRKQCEELLEECNEFLEEITSNLNKKNITYEETDELESALENLEKWYSEIKKRGFTEKEIESKVEELLHKCRRSMQIFAEKAQPKKLNEPLP
jgi:hypothetical protein